MAKQKNSCSQYSQKSTEGKASGRKGVKSISAPEFPKGCLFDDIDDDRRVTRKDPEHKFVPVEKIPDGFSVVGSEYFNVAEYEQGFENLPEELRAAIPFIIETDEVVESEPTIEREECPLSMFCFNEVALFTTDPLVVKSCASRESRPVVKKTVRPDVKFDPDSFEDESFRAKKGGPSLYSYKTRTEKFWWKENVKIKRRIARKNKIAVYSIAAENYLNDISTKSMIFA